MTTDWECNWTVLEQCEREKLSARSDMIRTEEKIHTALPPHQRADRWRLGRPPPQDQGGYCTIEVINTPQPSVTSRPIRNQPCYTIYKNRNLLPPTPSFVWEAEDLFSRRVDEPGAVDPNNLLSEVLHKRTTECYTVGLKVKAAIIRLCTHCKSIWSCGCPWVSPASDMGLIWYRCVGVAPGKIIATDQSNCLM